eukprot:gene12062-biopygen7909
MAPKKPGYGEIIQSLRTFRFSCLPQHFAAMRADVKAVAAPQTPRRRLVRRLASLGAALATSSVFAPLWSVPATLAASWLASPADCLAPGYRSQQIV